MKAKVAAFVDHDPIVCAPFNSKQSDLSTLFVKISTWYPETTNATENNKCRRNQCHGIQVLVWKQNGKLFQNWYSCIYVCTSFCRILFSSVVVVVSHIGCLWMTNVRSFN